ncbi:cytochrome P450 [Thermothelomyces heterothallicus CBS 202.75]|uniref:cytochrome P450 n=1 Tax=Thermothelomyces heterothallicus CBS 202.75 TaxID=1149848 RepID=UPI00374206AF
MKQSGSRRGREAIGKHHADHLFHTRGTFGAHVGTVGGVVGAASGRAGECVAVPQSNNQFQTRLLTDEVETASYFLLLRPLYNIYLHPLRRYPGPKLWAASSLPWGFSFLSGYWHHRALQLHTQYGHVVRIGPNELSFDVPEAWEDICGRSKHRKENPKAPWYLNPKTKEIVSAPLEEHTRMRRLLGIGFTNTAMLEQEPLIKSHVDLFIQRLHEINSGGKAAVDMFEWFAYCTFDIIGDLSFGEPFGCLRDSMLHPWIAWVFANIKLAHTLVLCNRIPFFFLFLPIRQTLALVKGAGYFEKTMKAVIDRRLARDAERPDLLQIMKTPRGSSVHCLFQFMTQEEIHSNASFLTMAGSETTSNSMAVAVYMICLYPETKAKIMDELAAAFNSESEIDMRSAGKLTYLMAVIQESMRYHPPGPNALWRITPSGGNEILGNWLPAKTILGIPHRVMYRREHNFKRANEFIPERWLDVEGEQSEFANDRRDSFHPFSYGPRTCLAVNLAYAEMRYILARLIWNFDFELAEQSRNWADGLRAWLIWEKRPLYVHLEPRRLK